MSVRSQLREVRSDLTTRAYGKGGALVAGALLLFLAPLWLTDNVVFQLGWIMIFAITTLGYNVIFGYTGLLSFGHAAFFGGGAYTVGLLMEYAGVDSLILLLGGAVLVSLVLSSLYGVISLRSHDIYYALLMLALAQVLYVFAVKFYGITNGTDGMRILRPSFLGIGFDMSLMTYITTFFYYVIALTFLLSAIVLWVMMRSSFGLTLKMIRENEDRARAVGVNVDRYKLYATIVSGVFPGIAGGMYAIYFAYITPSILDWTFSGDIVFMTLVGGASTFVGPIVGAGLFILLQQYALQFVSQYWQFVMGGILFVIVVTLRSDGLWGGLKKQFENRVRNDE